MLTVGLLMIRKLDSFDTLGQEASLAIFCAVQREKIRGRGRGIMGFVTLMGTSTGTFLIDGAVPLNTEGRSV